MGIQPVDDRCWGRNHTNQTAFTNWETSESENTNWTRPRPSVRQNLFQSDSGLHFDSLEAVVLADLLSEDDGAAVVGLPPPVDGQARAGGAGEEQPGGDDDSRQLGGGGFVSKWKQLL